MPTAFDGFVERSKQVSPTCLITFERNRYSVPASFANRPVGLHIYPERLVIVMLKACLRHDAEGHVVCGIAASSNGRTDTLAASSMTGVMIPPARPSVSCCAA